MVVLANWESGGDRPTATGGVMLRMKRKRYPHISLIARYRCPEHPNKPMLFTVALRPWSNRDPTPGFYGRPTAVICDCGMKMEYEGFVSRA